jgi:hypothetical protein
MLGRAPGFQGRYRAVLTPVHRLSPLRNDTSLFFVQNFRVTRDRRVTKWLAGARTPDKAAEKVVWVQTTNKASRAGLFISSRPCIFILAVPADSSPFILEAPPGAEDMSCRMDIQSRGSGES